MPAAPPLLALSAQSRWTDFFRGFALPFRSLRLLFRSKTLFLLAFASSVVTLLALLGLVALLGTSTDDLVGYFWAKPASWYGQAAWYLGVGLSFVVLLVVGANTVPLVLVAPLQDSVSEATESLCGGFTSAPFSFRSLLKGAAVSIGHTLARIALLLMGHLLLLPLHLIPGAGSVLWTVLGALWTMWWIAGEYLGIPMARHLYSFGQVRRALSARRGLSMGFGASVYLLLWLPVINLFFIPLAVIGGTLLFRSLRDAGHLGTPSEASGLAGQSLDAPLPRD